MKYKKGYKYILIDVEIFRTAILPEVEIKTPWIHLGTTGKCTLSPGYAWDGSTWAADTRWCMRASALHDAICQLVQDGLLDRKWKRQGDLEYYNLCRVDGMPLFMAINRLFFIQFHDWENSQYKRTLTVP